jgi:hypothetical protein
MVGFYIYRRCSCSMFAAVNEGVEIASEVEYCWGLIHRSQEHGRPNFPFQSPETFPVDLHAAVSVRAKFCNTVEAYAVRPLKSQECRGYHRDERRLRGMPLPAHSSSRP